MNNHKRFNVIVKLAVTALFVPMTALAVFPGNVTPGSGPTFPRIEVFDPATLCNQYANGQTFTLNTGDGQKIFTTRKGTSNADSIIGSANSDLICGLAGNDILNGAGGLDIVVGGAGDDTMYGGCGKDLLFGQKGSDKIFGEVSTNTIPVCGSNDGSSSFQDLMYGGEGADFLHGDHGTDSIFGGDYFGDDSADSVWCDAGSPGGLVYRLKTSSGEAHIPEIYQDTTCQKQ